MHMGALILLEPIFTVSIMRPLKTIPRIIYTRFRTKLAVLLRRIKNQNIEAEIKT